MPPAHERFEADHAMSRERYDRLVLDKEFAPCHRASQIHLKVEVPIRACLQPLIEGDAARGSQAFRFVRRRFGIAHSAFQAVVGRDADGDPHAHRRIQFDPVEINRML